MTSTRTSPERLVAQNDEYKTDSLGLAAAIAAAGFQLVRIDGDPPRHGEFVFRLQSGLSEAVEGYWNGRLKLPALHLVMQLRATKERLYEAGRMHRP